MTTKKPVISLGRNNAGRLFIGCTEFDSRGYGVRAFVLSSGLDTHDDVMRRRFNDMVRLMGDNVEAEWLKE